MQQTIAKAHHLLNLVSQDSCIDASLLLENDTFKEMLTVASMRDAETLESSYNELMSFVANNY